MQASARRARDGNTLPWLIAPLQTSDPQWKAQTVEWFRDVLNKDLSNRRSRVIDSVR